MSIAEKLTTVAENVPKVYKAGQASMVDESKIIKKTVSGSFISVYDVSEIPHSVGCKVSGVDKPESVSVTRTGKNLATAQQVWAGSQSYSEIIEDGRNTIRFQSSRTAYNKLPVFEENTQYTFSFDVKSRLVNASYEGKTDLILVVNYTDGTWSRIYFNPAQYEESVWTKRTLTSDAGKTIQSVGTVSYAYYYDFYVDVDTFQVEKGATVTEYEPYGGETYTPTADGTVEGMTSLSPYMNIFTDNAGVTLDVTYRKSWGMQTEYDRFWDSYQNTSIYPNRCGPAHFAGAGWNNDTFKPKYDIKVSNGYFLFYNCNVKGDLVAILNGLGVSLDTSEATSIQYLFWLSRFTRVGEINLTSLARIRGNTTQAFSTNTLITIDKMIVNENNVFATSTFTGATGLKNITIEGQIADSINFKDSPLSKDSILSVFNALSDTITGMTLTLKLSAVNTAFETSAGAADGSTSEEWNTLISTKSNWTISLV